MAKVKKTMVTKGGRLKLNGLARAKELLNVPLHKRGELVSAEEELEVCFVRGDGCQNGHGTLSLVWEGVVGWDNVPTAHINRGPNESTRCVGWHLIVELL